MSEIDFADSYRDYCRQSGLVETCEKCGGESFPIAELTGNFAPREICNRCYRVKFIKEDNGIERAQKILRRSNRSTRSR